MRLAANVSIVSLVLVASGCEARRAPAPLTPVGPSAPEFESLAAAATWFESAAPARLGSTVVLSSLSTRGESTYGRHVATTYEHVSLRDCVLQLTAVRSWVQFPSDPVSSGRPSRVRIRVPLRDLDPRSVAVRMVRDSMAIRPPVVVEMRTTAAAGPTITMHGHRALVGRATRLDVASPDEGTVVAAALVSAARLCGAQPATP